MTTHVRYKIDTGEIDFHGFSSNDVLPFEVPDGFNSIEGYGANQTHYVQNNVIVEYTDLQKTIKANKPTYDCIWSNTLFVWVDVRTTEQKNTEAENLAVSMRDLLLSNTDWIIIRSLDQGTPIPADWQTYRQSLRDITNQPGYPLNIIWPTPPQG